MQEKTTRACLWTTDRIVNFWDHGFGTRSTEQISEFYTYLARVSKSNTQAQRSVTTPFHNMEVATKQNKSGKSEQCFWRQSNLHFSNKITIAAFHCTAAVFYQNTITKGKYNSRQYVTNDCSGPSRLQCTVLKTHICILHFFLTYFHGLFSCIYCFCVICISSYKCGEKIKLVRSIRKQEGTPQKHIKHMKHE